MKVKYSIYVRFWHEFGFHKSYATLAQAKRKADEDFAEYEAIKQYLIKRVPDIPNCPNDEKETVFISDSRDGID